jgi:hypothetical protein
MQQFMTGEQVARVVGRGGESLFVTYNRDDIIGEYDYSVEGGSTQPTNDTIRKQQAVSLLNAMGPLVGTVIDPTALARHVLQRGFDIKDPDKFLMQQAPAMPAGPEGVPAPQGIPGGAGMPMPPAEASFAATGGVPPELVSQLQNQMGVELGSL